MLVEWKYGEWFWNMQVVNRNLDGRFVLALIFFV